MSASVINLNQLLSKVDTSKFRRRDYAVFFIWFLTVVMGRRDCAIKDIVKCYTDANLHMPRLSDLREILQYSGDAVEGYRPESFRVHRDALERLNSSYGSLIKSEPSAEEVIHERLNVSNTPFLTSTDIENAYKMGQLYVAIHCLENSVRCFIRNVLSKTLGEQWWDKAASPNMIERLAQSKSREAKNRWLSSRGADELNYMNWSDLVTLIRKYHEDFKKFVPDIKFLELKLEELENLRNTIAHSGVLPDEELNRVELALKDWCKLIS